MKTEEINENTDTSGNISDEDDPLVLAELKNKRPLTREETMSLSSQLIRICHQRAVRTRFKVSSKDQTRLAFARVASTLIADYSKLLKETELEQLSERISELEKNRQRERE